MSVWSFRYEKYDPKKERLREALCTLGNGYFATRGSAPESKADKYHYPGTYFAGCYDRLVTEINGQKIENESLVNAPNWLTLTFKIGNSPWFDLRHVRILEFEQCLDPKKGMLTKVIRFSDRAGRITRFVQRRLVHMEDPHLAGLETTLVAENWSGWVKFLSALDGRVSNTGVERYNRFNRHHIVPEEQSVLDVGTIQLSVKTVQSGIKFSFAARTNILNRNRDTRVRGKSVVKRGYVAQEFSVHLGKGESASVEKIVSLYTSRDMAISECSYASMKKISSAPDFATLSERHILCWDNLWRRFGLELKGDERVALAIHIHIFHLLQTVSPNSIDLDVGVPARGLHGEAYRGHIFWDELFIFPLLNLHIPDLTRSLLLYRYRRLPEARLAALKAGFKGAMYPWQSGSDGREESQIIHLNPLSNRWIRDNTYLQRHINLAIAYNVWSYYQTTHDMDFLSFYGAEIMLEIARFFGSVALYNKSRDRYEIHGVVGPDEYHDRYPGSKRPGINNNSYTNVMSVWVLCRALEILELIPERRREALCEKLGIRREEMVLWEDICHKMFVPINNGIISQFEGYEDLKEFDWSGYRKKYENIQRLDRILEAEGDSPNNYKASKQADVLMLFYLLSSDELGELFARLGYQFEYETIPKNIEYYLKRTSDGSTLSKMVHSWVIARRNREESWQIFKESLESDLSDIQGGTTAEGIHLGAMAGTVDMVQRCYTGLETRSDVLWLNPCLPKELKRLKYSIFYRGHILELDFGQSSVKVMSNPGPSSPIRIGFRETVFEMKAGEGKKLTY